MTGLIQLITTLDTRLIGYFASYLQAWSNY